ncbi:hypothetical protein [Lacrimispora sp.]|uniref:hypothetical protein n=1 Tax=Lacrimispora sp. TaxID=2719234 RepID=UPI0028AF678A|nr:hypothetical protein [Lacrimispora sp.]
MSYSVINGAVRKSPLIDKMNQLPVGQVKSRVPEQMEQLVSGHSEMIYQPVQLSFDRCREEVKRQLGVSNKEMEGIDG